MLAIPSSALIVDDEQTIQYALRMELEKMGMNCVNVSSGEEALEMTARREYDLIMLDVKMPRMSGLEVLRRIRPDHPETCLLMLSALVDVSIALEALQLGADDYITKPWDVADLASRLTRAKERRVLALRRGQAAAQNLDTSNITGDLMSQQVNSFMREVMRSRWSTRP